jgi:C4-dicarboxylate transporter DctQ subunit/C4-dicarboxylate transporter DctM subunit
MCFRFLQVMWRFLRLGTLPQHGHAAAVEAVTPPLAEPVAEPAR